MPSTNFEGAAFPAEDLYRYPISFAGGALIAVTNTGSSSSTMSVVNLAAATVGVYSLPTLQAGPSSGRAMKASVSLMNVTKSLNREGAVYAFNATQRINLPASPSVMTTDNWLTVVDNITSHPDVHEMTAEEFSRHREIVCAPVDTSAYHDYIGWQGAITAPEFWAHIGSWPGAGLRARPMSTAIFIIMPHTETNTYTAITRGTFYTRWPTNSVPGKNSVQVPISEASNTGWLTRAAKETLMLPNTLYKGGYRNWANGSTAKQIGRRVAPKGPLMGGSWD